MVEITMLWLPILLSAVFVFILSSIIHMAPLWHKNDYPAVPNQDKVMDALRPFNIPPGDYIMPRCATQAEMKTPEYTEKLKKGPVMIMTVLPNGPMTMGASLVQWFCYLIVVSIFAAYIAGRALGPGAEYLAVHRFAGATAFAGYTLAIFQTSIWYKRAWSTTLKVTFDGLLYALVTGGTFGWLWPR
jgi:hypothetical protein